MLGFSETIDIINGNPYVRPPDSILEEIVRQAEKNTSPIPVRGKINGSLFQQSSDRYQGDWRLYVNIIMAKAAQLKFSNSIAEIVGTEASFELEFDPQPPTYEIVSFLKEALSQTSVAMTNW